MWRIKKLKSHAYYHFIVSLLYLTWYARNFSTMPKKRPKIRWIIIMALAFYLGCIESFAKKKTLDLWMYYIALVHMPIEKFRSIRIARHECRMCRMSYDVEFHFIRMMRIPLDYTNKKQCLPMWIQSIWRKGSEQQRFRQTLLPIQHYIYDGILCLSFVMGKCDFLKYD